MEIYNVYPNMDDKENKMENEQVVSPQPTPEVPVVENEQVEDGQDEVVENKAPADVKAEKKRLKQLQLKIDGQEVLEDLPFEIEEEHADYMRKQLQMSKAAQKRMQESKALEAQVKEFLGSLKSDTKNTLKQMGIDPKEFAAAILEEEIKAQQMSPEQRELEQLKAEKKKYEEERKKEKEEYERKEYERLTQQEYERIDIQMTKALDNAGLPKSPYAVKKMAEYMLIAAQNGVDIQPEEISELVKDEIHADLQQLLQSLGEDKAESFIGKDVLTKIRKKNVQKAKTPASEKASIKDVANKKDQPKEQEKKTIKELFGF